MQLVDDVTNSKHHYVGFIFADCCVARWVVQRNTRTFRREAKRESWQDMKAEVQKGWVGKREKHGKCILQQYRQNPQVAFSSTDQFLIPMAVCYLRMEAWHIDCRNTWNKRRWRIHATSISDSIKNSDFVTLCNLSLWRYSNLYRKCIWTLYRLISSGSATYFKVAIMNSICFRILSTPLGRRAYPLISVQMVHSSSKQGVIGLDIWETHNLYCLWCTALERTYSDYKPKKKIEALLPPIVSNLAPPAVHLLTRQAETTK